VVLTLLSTLYGESCLLVSWCANDMCGMVGNDEDCGKSRRPGAEDWEWSSTGRVLCGWTIEMSGDAVCGLYHARGDEECGFLGLASKPRSTICQWCGIKTTGTGFPVWASKPIAMVW
jgi:hypothetical protein